MKQKIGGALLIVLFCGMVVYNYYQHLGMRYNDEGVDLADQENYTGSIIHYKKAIEMNKNESLYYYNIGKSYYHMGDYNRALVYFDNAIYYYGDIGTYQLLNYPVSKSELYSGRGASYYWLYRYAESEKDIDTALEGDKNDLWGLYFKALIAFDNNQLRDSLIYLDTYLLQDPQDEEAIYLKADNYYYLKDYKEAITWFLQGKNYYSSAFSELHMGNYAQAYTYFEQSLLQEDTDDSTDALGNRQENFYLAYTLYLQGDYEKAKNIFETIIKQDYSEIESQVLVFYTLTVYELGKQDEWLIYIQDKIDKNKLAKHQDEINKIFLEGGMQDLDVFLYNNQIYLKK